jgi:hypothetical protein
MPIKKIALYELKTNDIICSVYSNNKNKWLRDLNDINNNLISINELTVYKSFNKNENWVVYLYDKNSMNNQNIFHLNLDIYKTVAIFI